MPPVSLLQEGLLEVGEGTHGSKLDHRLHLSFEQHRQHEDTAWQHSD